MSELTNLRVVTRAAVLRSTPRQGTMESFNLLETLSKTAELRSKDTAYVFLGDGESESERIDFGALNRGVSAVASALRERCEPGDRALLLYAAGLDFIVAFLGCLRAGVVAVPYYPPRPREGADKVLSISSDSGARLVLTSSSLMPHLQNRFTRAGKPDGLDWLATDAIVAPAMRDPGYLAERFALPRGEELAFIQYTSGSTGAPKGVMVSHANIAHNEGMIERAFGHSRASVVVGWLPFFHDMGLIGNMLQPLHVGGVGIFMSPMSFLQRPVRWLRAISDYRATTSGGPNFAFDLCVEKITSDQCEGLDLSSWDLAFNGAEPVKRDTLERFARTFAPYGFRKESLFPCYGLAEATLFVTGGQKDEASKYRVSESAPASALVGCGGPRNGLEVRIVDPESHAPCPPGHVGEIWVRGPSVARGYWNKDELTRATFAAHLADTHEGPYLRTGDVGFLEGGELYVTGRIKDVLIVRGRKYHPQDIEHTAERSHTALKPAGGAAFTAEARDRERLVVVHEVRKEHLRSLDGPEIFGNVREAIAAQHGLTVDALVLLPPGGVLRTSSGKVRRGACRAGLLDGSLLRTSLATFGRLPSELPSNEWERSCS